MEFEPSTGIVEFVGLVIATLGGTAVAGGGAVFHQRVDRVGDAGHMRDEPGAQRHPAGAGDEIVESDRVGRRDRLDRIARIPSADRSGDGGLARDWLAGSRGHRLLA